MKGMRKRTWVIALVAAGLSVAGLPGVAARADCTPHWLDVGSGFDGPVTAITTWDPDGSGPQAAWLVVGGSFSTAAGVPASGIAAWDGQQWHSLGGGTTGDYYGKKVAALAVYNDELIAGGYFTAAGGVACNRIAKWNGTSWAPLGTGMEWCVLALTIYNGELIAGGQFTTAGGASCHGIARWNGTTWQQLGSGVGYFQCCAEVEAVTIYNGDLIAGGQFDTAGGVSCKYIARWNGTNWQSLGSGMNGDVCALAVYNTDLVAGGWFLTAGGTSAYGIAKWNGASWSALGSGVNDRLNALTVYNSNLIAGGKFTSAGGSLVNFIAQWNGTQWAPLGTGMAGDYPYVWALGVRNGELIAGGGFTSAGGIPSEYWARWGCGGACCFADGRCEELSQDACANGSGFYGGDGTTCTPNPCPCPDSTPPAVQITSPLAFSCNCDSVTITGSASDPDGEYIGDVLEYKSLGQPNWTWAAEASGPRSGPLYVWDTSLVAGGYYLVRVSGHNSCGLSASDTSVAYISHSFGGTALRSPADDALLGGVVCFDGTASSGCFANYSLTYKPLSGGSFTPVDPDMPVYTTGVTNDPLGSWQTASGPTMVPDGDYYVRLWGTTVCGDTEEVVHAVTIDNTAPVGIISAPLACQTVEGVVQVIGTATDANLSGWAVYYTGGDQHGWVLLNSGSVPVIEGVLSNWDTTDLRPCEYTLLLLVSDGAVVNCFGGHTTAYMLSVGVGVNLRGDLNSDGLVDLSDIEPFVLALVDPGRYLEDFPNGDAMSADCNGDGLVNGSDVPSFTAMLLEA